MDVRVLSHLKEKLAWAADKWLWVISTTMLFKNSYSIKGTKEYNCFKFKTILFALLSGP